MTFITFEGIEGCGKSTQAMRLARALGPDVLLTQEPGGTALGLSIRSLLLEPREEPVVRAAELLLYFADRAQHVAERLRPALAEGRTVISDRYVDSSLAYQGYGRGIPLEEIRSLALVATGGLRPDLTLLIEVPVEMGLGRVARRGGPDRLEGERFEFHERVRQGYLALAAEDEGRWIRVDGTGAPDAVTTRILAAVEARGLAVHGLR